MSINFTIHVQEEDVPVRGNAIASGDDAYDKQVEDEILARLADGDIWAWASVEVRAEWNGLTGSAYLGCCCYEDEENFIKDSHQYLGMKFEALRELRRVVDAVHSKFLVFELDSKILTDEILEEMKADYDEQAEEAGAS